ncbi:MAG: glycosyltransferase family 2 protein [Pseudomonadota bacterium]
MDKTTTIAVVVCYEPDLARLTELLSATRPQVDALVVVDNGSDVEVESVLAEMALHGEIHVLQLSENSGLAYAQNQGIEWARSQGASHILLLDQDSLPAKNMVGILLAAHAELLAAGLCPSAVGPRLTDAHLQRGTSFFRSEGLRTRWLNCETGSETHAVDGLIASGSLIPITVLAAVGPMNGDLFIDYVDREWHLRARRCGFQAFGICAANMIHRLGDEPVKVAGHSVPMHQSLRHYYYFRNAVWLYRQSWVPWVWKLSDGWRLIRKFVFYAVFAHPRRAHLAMMLRGIRHGMANRLGKFG